VGVIEPKFKKWLCSGRKEIFTEEEANKIWHIWNIAKFLAYSGYIYLASSDESDLCVLYTDIRPEDSSKKFVLVDDQLFSHRPLDKEKFFEYVLENINPERIRLDIAENEGKCLYEFPKLQCEYDLCPCEMEIDKIKIYHHLDIRE
jgi:hypothetical protein